MQLITIKRIIGIPSASASTLCRFGVFVVDEVASVTKFWCPICIGPNACSFAVVCTIHTIIDAHKGQALNNGACLQKPRIWVFQEPYGWVQVVDQGQASLHKRICFVQVPWGFCSRASPAVLRTVWGRPNHVKVPGSSGRSRAILSTQCVGEKQSEPQSTSTTLWPDVYKRSGN